MKDCNYIKYFFTIFLYIFFSGFMFVPEKIPNLGRKDFLKEIFLFSCVSFGLEKSGVPDYDISIDLTIELNGDYSQSIYEIRQYGINTGRALSKQINRRDIISRCFDMSQSAETAKIIDSLERAFGNKKFGDY